MFNEIRTRDHSSKIMGLYGFCLLVAGCLVASSAADSELLRKLEGGVPASTAETKPLQTHLADHPACQKDLSALASRCQLTQEEIKNDFAALMCVQQRSPKQFEAISETCEQVLWTYKNQLTKGGHLIQQVEEVLITDIHSMMSCVVFSFSDLFSSFWCHDKSMGFCR